MMRILRIHVAVLLLIFANGAVAEDWPQFRGPTGQGISKSKNLPIEWNASKNVAWKIDVGTGWSSPVVASGKLYLTAAVDDPKSPSLRAICIDVASGKVLWDTEVFRPDAKAFSTKHQKNSPASSTPIVTADRLFVHFGHLGTAALDLSGKVLWKQESIKYPPVHGNGGSPVLVSDLLIFNCDGGSEPFVAALDAKTGDVKWKTPRDTHAKAKFSFSTPLAIEVGGATQVISPGSGFVGAYSPTDGKEIWRVRYGEGYSVVPRPVFSHGLIFVSSGYDVATFYAVRVDGAKGDSTDKHIAWTNKRNAPNTPSPLVIGDKLYLVSDSGIATCSDVETGKVHWTKRLEGNFSASPISADSRIYFQSEEGVGYVLQASKEFKLISENDLQERSLASYAATDGAIFIRTEKHL